MRTRIIAPTHVPLAAVLAFTVTVALALALVPSPQADASSHPSLVFRCDTTTNPDGPTAEAQLFSDVARTDNHTPFVGWDGGAVECEMMTRAQYRNSMGQLVWTAWEHGPDEGWPVESVVQAGVHTNDPNAVFTRSQHCARVSHEGYGMEAEWTCHFLSN